MGTQIEQFEILLEHDIDEQYQYEPGEMLCGTVELTVNEPIKITAIQVQIRGESTVSWEEEGRMPVTFKADEVYIDATQNVMTSEPGTSVTLDRGVHRYPMEYILPHNLPSSFIGKHGSITYVVKATLKEDKRFGLSTMITSEPFLVLRKLDLSTEHALMMSREERMEKRFSGGIAFCVGGKVSVTFKVNKTGHLPGEDIFMDAEISNQSPRVVEAIEASILMHSTFHAKNKTRYNKQVVNKKRDEWELIEGEGRRWKGVRLTIPPYIPESRLDGCDIIDIRYELTFRVDISGKNNFLNCSIPITVGSASDGIARPKRENQTNTVSNWRSKDDLYDTATLSIRGQGNEAPDNGVANNNDANLNGGYAYTGGDANVQNPDDVDFEMFREETLQFRRPIGPGEVRENPLMAFVEENGEHELNEMHKQMSVKAPIQSDPEDEAHYSHSVDPDENYIPPDETEGSSDQEHEYDGAPKAPAPPPPIVHSGSKKGPAPPPPPPLRPGP